MKQVFYLFIMIVLVASCETEGFKQLNEEPIFLASGILAGENLSLQAGLNGVENKPGIVEQNGQLTYFSNFSIPASSGSTVRQISLQCKQFPKVTNELMAETQILNDNLEFVLSYTGVEGLEVTPEIGNILDLYTDMWFIDGQVNTTESSVLIPNPILLDKSFVNIRYNLNIPGKFTSSINSQISNQLEQSCHGKLDIETSMDEATISFSSQNPDINMIEWGTGEQVNDITINLEPQTLFVEASSPDCTMNVQLDITDPFSMPTEIGFGVTEIVGPATGADQQGFVLEVIDEQGEIYRSDYGIQGQNSKLKINQISQQDLQFEGNAVLIVEASIDAQLLNLDQSKSISLSNGAFTFAFAHPVN